VNVTLYDFRHSMKQQYSYLGDCCLSAYTATTTLFCISDCVTNRSSSTRIWEIVACLLTQQRRRFSSYSVAIDVRELTVDTICVMIATNVTNTFS
jgi:hypothetical protein